MVKLIIFDVCWTLYRSNTTFDFIKYVYKVEGINSFKLDFLNSLIGRFLILLLGKLVGRDIYRELFVDLLKGFSKESLENLITKAKDLGYQVIIHYVTVTSPEMAIERVAHRVKHNGHGIPDDVVIRRYYSSKSNFELVKKYADIIYEWDNSNEDGIVTGNKTVISQN